ncbi:GntR family transcriptional regulator [Oceanicola sp. 22II-s10i]|uniref:phosphonate metabolism transcriptional regulator PhnF n=1 Tax=Oceanicola sp. 22II-s10i TaxID=1317116 RepID=UPI000B5245E8|nr:phosphonate metabolism transcriptional regulator PhnF [Oceanicola sp. 22II-s10i]OWU85003.1 GntR family transcriptional regulator [Oceanicola sp. 22II-s10i]
MARTPVWKSIVSTLEDEIARGHYRPGDKIPTEAELATRFGVNRHTVRRGLSDLSERGILHARRGAGVFVATTPTEYPMGRRVRFHQNIRATGRTPERRMTRLETRPCDAREAELLALAPGDQVLVSEGMSLSEGTPLAVFESLFPVTRLPGFEAALREIPSVTEALKRAGVPDYVRTETRLQAEPATATQALHLRLAEGAPLLKSTGLNKTPDGVPVEFGTTWFAGDRVTLIFAD